MRNLGKVIATAGMWGTVGLLFYKSLPLAEFGFGTGILLFGVFLAAACLSVAMWEK